MVQGSGFGEPIPRIAWSASVGQVYGCAPLCLPQDEDAEFQGNPNRVRRLQEGELVDFLHENRDIFAWSPKDMPGVPTEFAEHKLHVRSDMKPVR